MADLDVEKPAEKQQSEPSAGGKAFGGNNKGAIKKPRPDRRDKDRKPNKASAGEAPKKVFKVCIRKLPPAREFNEQEFHANVARVVSQLGLAPDAILVEHFVGGKLR